MTKDEWSKQFAKLGRRGGSVTTEKKAAAARRNGAKGGRPLKVSAAPARRRPAFTDPDDLG